MSCQRSYEIDLAAFLAGSSDPALRDFRSHYPGCEECAAEVRAWTELHDDLRAASPDAGHPAEEVLLAFEEGSPSLDAARRVEIERHLSRCAPCRDELAALRSFDFSALRRPVPARRSRSLVTPLRALLLHPAFAYALVLLLLVPTLVERMPFGPRPEARESRRAERKEKAAIDVSRARDAEPAAPPAAPEPSAAYVAAPPPQNLAGGEMEARRAKIGGGLAKSEPPAEYDAARGRPLAAPPAPPAIAHRLRDERERQGVIASPNRQPLAAAGAPRAGMTPQVAVWQPDGGMLLRIPVRRAGVDLEVRVLSPDGRRELRERMRTTADGAPAELHVPAAWLQPGEYRVEVRAAGESRENAAELYGFSVP